MAVVTLLAGCTVMPSPLDADARARLAAQSYAALFEAQEPLKGPLTLAEAMARAIKYQAEYRQRQMEQAAAEAQIDVARFDLLPRLTANAGYTTRNNDAFGFGFSPNGQVATNPSASTERNRDTASLGFSWNLLDFGVSYFRARQLADQSLIAEERRRKAMQTLVHDVRVAWWRAEAAQRLLPAADALLAEIDRASERTRVIEARKLLPPQQTATLRRALLDLAQQISFRRQELGQARLELAALVNIPPGTDYRVAGPDGDEREVLDFTADIGKLEELALRARPEIAEEGYRARISADEARKALVGLLPGITFDLARNFDSNRFLVNNTWSSAGLSVALNLVRLFSLPALGRAEEAQLKADSARRLAMAMAVLSQTRIAALRDELIADEFLVWNDATRDDDLIVGYLASSAKAGIDTELELIRTRARAMASRMNRDISYANLQAAAARLYHSVGFDAVPREDEGKTVAALAQAVEVRFAELERSSFTRPPALARPTVAVGEVRGLARPAGEMLRAGARHVLELSKIPLADAANAELQLTLDAELDSVKDGRRGVRVKVRLLRATGASAGEAEFRTTTSEPVDDGQWQAIGEGAAYRLLDRLLPLRTRRSSLRLAESLESVTRPSVAADQEDNPAVRGAPLRLRADLDLRPAAAGRTGPGEER
ncbi:MAG: TolC family protein [Betaproteobacteria bacterium]